MHRQCQLSSSPAAAVGSHAVAGRRQSVVVGHRHWTDAVVARQFLAVSVGVEESCVRSRGAGDGRPGVSALVISAAVDEAGVIEGEPLAAAETAAADAADEARRVKDAEMHSDHEVTGAEHLVTASTTCRRRPLHVHCRRRSTATKQSTHTHEGNVNFRFPLQTRRCVTHHTVSGVLHTTVFAVEIEN